MKCIRSVPDVISWRALRAWPAAALALALVLVMTGCSEEAPDATETLEAACAEAREDLAAAPTPTDEAARREFVEAAGGAADTVAEAIAGLGEQVDEQAMQDLLWQLNSFPRQTDEGEAVRVAHEASAAILRIDRFAEALGVSECDASTWRPADWRTLAGRLGEDVSESTFREELNQLCAQTFPNPQMLAEGTPMLPALVGESEDAENVYLQLLQRLNTLNNRQADAGQFIRNFSHELSLLEPPENLQGEHTALVAAFMGIDAAVPRVIPRNPSPEFRNRVDAAFDELERTWSELQISC